MSAARVHHLWVGEVGTTTYQWACTVAETADFELVFVAHDPDVLDESLFDAILVHWGKATDDQPFDRRVEGPRSLSRGPSPIGRDGAPRLPGRGDSPVFSDEEYEARELEFHEAYDRLPIVLMVDELGIRWLGPLVDLALDGVLGDLEAAAYGYLEDCGWRGHLEGLRAGETQFTPEYATAFGRAARALAEAGENAGPDPDPEVWASWLAFHLSGIASLIRGRATAAGWDR